MLKYTFRIIYIYVYNLCIVSFSKYLTTKVIRLYYNYTYIIQYTYTYYLFYYIHECLCYIMNYNTPCFLLYTS